VLSCCSLVSLFLASRAFFSSPSSYYTYAPRKNFAPPPSDPPRAPPYALNFARSSISSTGQSRASSFTQVYGKSYETCVRSARLTRFQLCMRPSFLLAESTISLSIEMCLNTEPLRPHEALYRDE
jgi:hypothetical protein